MTSQRQRMGGPWGALKMGHAVYPAGLWKRVLDSGLVWDSSLPSVPISKCLQSVQQSAPSWSSAFCDERVMFLHRSSWAMDNLIPARYHGGVPDCVGHNPYDEVIVNGESVDSIIISYRKVAPHKAVPAQLRDDRKVASYDCTSTTVGVLYDSTRTFAKRGRAQVQDETDT